MPLDRPSSRPRFNATSLVVILCVLAVACGDGGGVVRSSGSPESSHSRVFEGPVLVVGPGQAYAKIGDAVARAPEGATIIVRAGTYPEKVELSQALTIEAEGDGPAVIDAECERKNGIWIPVGADIVVRGLEIRNTTEAGVLIGLGPPDKPIPERITLEGLTITGFNCTDSDVPANAGIAAWHAGCCMTLRDNTITYRGEGDQRGRANGIWFKSNSEVPSGGGHTITGNTIRGGWDGIGGETEGDEHGTFDRDTLIQGNRISECLDDGIQVEGGNEDVRVVDNEVSGCASGIAFAPTLVGPLYIERNAIRDLEEGIYDNRSCFKLGYEGEGTIYLTENICDTHGDGLLQSNAGTSPIVSRRNCIDVTGVTIGIGDIRDMDLQEDFLRTISTDRFAGWDGENYATLRDFQRATGQEEGGPDSAVCPLSP